VLAASNIRAVSDLVTVITVAMVMLFKGFWALCILSACWLVGDHLLLRDFGSCRIKFMNVYVVMTVAMVMLLRDVGAS
jgi:hypothetical protein